MATSKLPRDDNRYTDKETMSILFEGANLSQLGALFKVDHRILKEKMAGVLPCGRRNNADIYDVAEVATKMHKMTAEQIDVAIRRYNPIELPKTLTKEFWAGQRSKQEFQLRAGDLWPTTKLVEEVSEMVKLLKIELDLLTDAIERQTEMSEKQRELAMMLIDGAKTNMVIRLKERFAKAPPKRPDVVLFEDDEL